MNIVGNPWHELTCENGRYLLGMDREDILGYSAKVSSECKVVLESIPEPFIGNPESARVVVLLLNPGHHDDDIGWHRRDDFKRAMLRNLRHELHEYPFYPLNPEFSEAPSAKWWRPLLQGLRDSTGLKDAALSERLMAIEWFPYHSKRSALPKREICASQKYTFGLAKKMLRSKLVIGMRSKKHWLKVDQDFSTVPFLFNPRRCYLTRGNMEEKPFDQIVGSLKG